LLQFLKPAKGGVDFAGLSADSPACGFLRNLKKKRIEQTTCRQYQSLALKIPQLGTMMTLNISGKSPETLSRTGLGNRDRSSRSAVSGGFAVARSWFHQDWVQPRPHAGQNFPRSLQCSVLSQDATSGQ
jgi:hypothetical protein